MNPTDSVLFPFVGKTIRMFLVFVFGSDFRDLFLHVLSSQTLVVGFFSARRSFCSSSFVMFAVNRSLNFSVSRPLSLQFGLLKLRFTTSSVRLQWSFSRVFVLACFLVNASYLSKV